MYRELSGNKITSRYKFYLRCTTIKFTRSDEEGRLIKEINHTKENLNDKVSMESFMYILLCSDKTFYTGVTSNLGERLKEHQSGKYPNSYTASRLPVELVYYATFTDINQAIEFEKENKKMVTKEKTSVNRRRV
ncbi:hypothetical protein CAPN008_16180 [Capnocytophaga canis]|nr:hypothetical protein CAPN008_16180 [Capnocytophaga canis]